MFAYKAHIETTLTHTDYKVLYEQSQLQIQSLQLQLAELKKMIFGSKGEKFIASSNTSAVQPDLFPDDKLGEHTVIKTTLIKSFEKKQTALAVKHPGRNPLPDSLRREVIELLLRGKALLPAMRLYCIELLYLCEYLFCIDIVIIFGFIKLTPRMCPAA